MTNTSDTPPIQHHAPPAHTPTPWQIIDLGDEDRMELVLVGGEKEKHIARLYQSSDGEFEDLSEEETDAVIAEEEANYALLVAAPELAEHLEQSLQDMKDLRNGDWEPGEEEFQEVVNAHYDVLQKATGTDRSDETREQFIRRQTAE